MKAVCYVLLLAFFCNQTLGAYLYPCEWDRDVGHCSFNITRYYYHKYTSRCERFIYGGCGGNVNRFPTIEDCQAMCVTSGYRCYLPSYSGWCGDLNNQTTKYFYNSWTTRCETFVYYGCDGNNNRFETIEECEVACANEGKK